MAKTTAVNVDERAEEAINHLDDARESLNAAVAALNNGPHSLYPDSMYASGVLADDTDEVIDRIKRRHAGGTDNLEDDPHVETILERADF